jgi:hypothetical protein
VQNTSISQVEGTYLAENWVIGDTEWPAVVLSKTVSASKMYISKFGKVVMSLVGYRGLRDVWWMWKRDDSLGHAATQ